MTTSTPSGTFLRIAFEGQEGSHSETVAIELFGNATYRSDSVSTPLVPNNVRSPSTASPSTHVTTVGFPSFESVFEAVAMGSVDYGILPIENSVTGTFYKVLDLLHQKSLFIVGEYQHQEHQCLMALPGVKVEDITHITSHPYVLDQCRKFITNMGPGITIEQSIDTAASAKSVSTSSSKTIAAIGSSRSAAMYNLQILHPGIEDDPNNTTRYILVSKNRSDPERHQQPKTSLSVILKNQTGAFFKALSCFSLRDINICKIESRPSPRSNPSHPWEYILYLDVQGGTRETPIQKAIDQLSEYGNVRVLGSYTHFRPKTAEVRSSGMYGIGG